MPPDLSIVIVSWNVCDMLLGCLESIETSSVCISDSSADGLTTEVIVVDSDSADGTPDVIRSQYPSVKLIEPGSNVGFTKGNNIGIAASRGRYVLLLNPDTKILANALPHMVDYMTLHPGVGALGPQLLNEDGSVQSSRRRFPTIWTAFFESTWLQAYAPPKVLDKYYVLDHDDNETVRVDWVQGAALLVRREVIEQVGLMDEGFFMYSEELDWQHRMKIAGWNVVYYPEAKIIHYGGKSSEQVIAQRDIYYHSSKVRYFRKYHGLMVAFVLRLYLLANFAWQIGLELVKWVLGHKREMRMARVHAYWEVLCSGLKGT